MEIASVYGVDIAPLPETGGGRKETDQASSAGDTAVLQKGSEALPHNPNTQRPSYVCQDPSHANRGFLVFIAFSLTCHWFPDHNQRARVASHIRFGVGERRTA